jgi:aromatic-L-amino-acid decarboxylase
MLLQISSPACTELEVVMLDWLGKMLELPKEFLAASGGKGGGVIQVIMHAHLN